MARYMDRDYDRDWGDQPRSDYEPGNYGRNQNLHRYDYRDHDHGFDRTRYRGEARRWGHDDARHEHPEHGRYSRRDYQDYDRPGTSDYDRSDHGRYDRYTERGRHREYEYDRGDYDRTDRREQDRDGYGRDWFDGYYRRRNEDHGYRGYTEGRDYQTPADERHGHRGPRYDRRDEPDEERGFWSRARNEVRSWFDEEDDRRRRNERRQRHDDRAEWRDEYEPNNVW